MADHAAAPCLVDLIGVHRQEGRHLGLDRVDQHLPGTFTQHSEQRIILNRTSWPWQPNNGILLQAYRPIGDLKHHRGYAASHLIPKFDHSSRGFG